MANNDNSNKESDFLRELLGDDLYSELKEDERATIEAAQNAVSDLPPKTLDEPEDDDVKIYDKDKMAANKPSVKVEYTDGDKPTFVTRYSGEPEASDDSEDEEDDEDDVLQREIPPTLKGILYVVGVVVVAAVLALVVWLAADDVLGLTGDDETVSFTVTDLDTVGSISKRLKDDGLIKYPLLFQVYGLFSNADEKIESGTFELSNVYDYRALVLAMVNYEQSREIVTVVIPEGYEQEQIFELLEQNGVASVADLSQTAANHDFDYAFLDGLEMGLYNRLEGYLFPDTYDFYVGEDSENVINKLLANFDRRFDEDMLARIDELNGVISQKIMDEYGGHYPDDELLTYIDERMLDEHDIVTIASLIEKEAANNQERSKISSVIHNRLISKLYPTLKIDATIQYVLAQRKEVLTYDDLSVDSPYNTYKNAGLPVGPIANPGIASIRAALYPDETDYYFYALDTDGTHHFSRTSEEHTDFLLSIEDSEDENAE